MDVAYTQHEDRARRKARSPNHLSLAPLTSKLPLRDEDLIIDTDVHSHSQHHAHFGTDSQSPLHASPSYLQGKSAPTTPRLFSRSPTTPRSRSHQRTESGPAGALGKSKSASHLAAVNSSAGPRRPLSGRNTPGHKPREDNGFGFGPRHRNDSDWLLRTGALVSSEARESKGQAWLVSRQSSTSLTALHDPDVEAFEEELAREREITASRHASRRGSTVLLDEDASPYASRHHSRRPSRHPSRAHSRSHSLSRPLSQMMTPIDRPIAGNDSYFPAAEEEDLDETPGPDFVNLDARLEELEQDTTQDEATIQRLVRRGQANGGLWFGNVWSLFSVDENDEAEEEDESVADGTFQLSRSRSWSSRHLAGITTAPEERIPPPSVDNGGWRDAAWLLSVASKVMF